MSIDQQILSNLNDSSTKDDATIIILNILKTIENQSLRASEMRNIYITIHKIFQKYELRDNYQLESLVNYRFSMEYIPSINSLSTKNGMVKSVVVHENLSSQVTNIHVSSNSEDNRTRQVALNDPDVKSNYYYLCSIHKHQSTLSTSYRLFLDGTKEIHPVTKEVSNCIMNDKPIMILGAKKFKYKTASSDSNPNIIHSYVWNHIDSKLWKEKNAIGRLTRINQNRYIGILLPIITNSIGNTKNNNLNNNSSSSSYSSSIDNTYAEGSIAISVHSRGLDKLIHLNAAAIRTRKSQHSNELEQSGMQDVDNTCDTTIHSTTNNKTYSQQDLNNINSNRQNVDDKMSHPSLVNEKEIMHSLEGILNHLIVSIDNNTTAKDMIEANENILYLKSKQPRNAYDYKGKMIHTVVFSNESRVKAPSRKNLVIDTINTHEKSSTEWIVESNKPALIQIGKLEEGLFSLDFYGISPFQAFSIALAAFDQ